MTFVAPAKTNQPTAVLAILTINAGRRPNLSERAPKIGALKNEQSEKTANSIVIVKAEASMLWTKYGITGIIMPNPMTSINMVDIMIIFSLDNFIENCYIVKLLYCYNSSIFTINFKIPPIFVEGILKRNNITSCTIWRT
ncbi:MAG: hypothetical protein WCT26_04885 [Candidatus Buchananbacteria bacterium]|jgi:hypothetical protein